METKPFRLTPSEINRAEPAPNGRLFTIISRLQENGQWMVLPIDVATGLPVGEHFAEWADSKEGLAAAAREVNRWLSKMGCDTSTTRSSRNRNK